MTFSGSTKYKIVNVHEILWMGRFFRCNAPPGLDVVREAHSPGAPPQAIPVRALRARFVINLPFLLKTILQNLREEDPKGVKHR